MRATTWDVTFEQNMVAKQLCVRRRILSNDTRVTGMKLLQTQ